MNNARIHVQNLPPGTTVSSPAEAHQGQTSYELSHQDVRIIGFYSRNHKGVFTHHDTHIHAHLITKNGDKMGHLDSIVLSRTFTLYLPFQADK